MMKKICLAFFLVSLNISLYSQNSDKQTIPCFTSEVMEAAFKANPNLRQKYNLVQSHMQLEYEDAMKQQAQKKVAAPVYTVPVVFHILHQGGAENVSDAQIIALLDQVNKDFSRGGSDVATIHPTFNAIYKDTDIRFALAKRDPNGNCTNGIIRHLDSKTAWDMDDYYYYSYSGTGPGRWPTNNYLNIYIVRCIGSTDSPCPVGVQVAGYTRFPGSSPSSAADAIVCRYDNISGASARVLSHEIGHWLNLSHVWGPNNNAGFACGDDDVPDTPETKGHLFSCPGGNTGPFSGCSALENVENIMDYSSCKKMFTEGQGVRMRSALTSFISGRNNLCTPSNYDATGLSSSYTCLPNADFNSNLAGACEGQTIIYNNLSNVGLSGSYSWVFEGGMPAVSTASNPSVLYANAGTYSVSLTSTNASGSSIKNKTSYINISKRLDWVTVPDAYNFDVFSGVPKYFTIKNYDLGSVEWDYVSGSGALSTPACMYLHNFVQTNSANQKDAFETAVYNFENTTNVSLSYYYAYAKKVTEQIDSFKVQYSFDCGGTWSNVIGIPSAVSMAANSGGVNSADYIPAASDWKQALIPSSLLSILNHKPSVKFRFYFKSDAKIESSNNIYIDQINLAGTVGLNELENNIGLTIYPNPTNASSVVDFNIYNNEKITISVTDLMGRVLESNSVSSTNNHVTYTINKNNNLAKGIYLVHVNVNGQDIAKKLIID